MPGISAPKLAVADAALQQLVGLPRPVMSCWLAALRAAAPMKEDEPSQRHAAAAAVGCPHCAGV